MKLNYRKKSNDCKSNFYLHPYTTSISHEPPSSAQNMDNSRSRSHSNLVEINSSGSRANTTSSSNQSHSGTFSRLAKYFFKGQKKSSHNSSCQNLSNAENKELKTLISSPEHLNYVPNFERSKSNNFIMDAETREELRNMLRNLTVEERIQLQQKGLELLKVKVNEDIEEKKKLEKAIDEIKIYLTTKRQQLRSFTDIESLRNEIRSLTNEKAALELKIIQNTNWKCVECTYINPYDKSYCEACNKKRQLNEFILCKYCSSRNSLSSSSCLNCANLLLEDNEGSSRTRQSSNSSSCSNVRVNSAQSNMQNGARIPAYIQGQANYTSQSSSSSNLSVFMDNPVYFNLNETGDARLPPRSPHTSSSHLQDQTYHQQPTIPVILDENHKCKFKKKFF